MWGRRGGCLVVGRSPRCSLDSCNPRRSHASPPTPPAGLAPLAPGPGASPDRLLHPACKTCSFAERKLESEVGGVWPLPLRRLILLNRLELPPLRKSFPDLAMVPPTLAYTYSLTELQLRTSQAASCLGASILAFSLAWKTLLPSHPKISSLVPLRVLPRPHYCFLYPPALPPLLRHLL